MARSVWDLAKQPRFTPYPAGYWGYVHVESETDIDDELMSW